MSDKVIHKQERITKLTLQEKAREAVRHILRSPKKFLNSGFSIIELVVALLLVAILASIAVPLYTNAKNKSYQQNTLNDGDSLNKEILATIGDNNVYSTFGTTNGGIAYNSGTSLLTVTLGAGVTSPAPFSIPLSKNTIASGVTYANSTSWCLEIFNTNQSSVFTNLGLSNTLKTCGAGFSSSNHFLNSSFETDASNWSTCYNPGSLTSTLVTSSANFQLGSQSLLRTTTSGSGASQMNLCANLAPAYIANKTYVFSTYVYTNRAHNISLTLTLNAVSGTTSPGATVAVPANTWTQISYTATMPSDLTSLTTVQLVDSPFIGDLLYVDNAQSY